MIGKLKITIDTLKLFGLMCSLICMVSRGGLASDCTQIVVHTLDNYGSEGSPVFERESVNQVGAGTPDCPADTYIGDKHRGGVGSPITTQVYNGGRQRFYVYDSTALTSYFLRDEVATDQGQITITCRACTVGENNENCQRFGRTCTR